MDPNRLNQEQIIICIKGNLEDILSLVDGGCDINKILFYVCHYGHLEVVKYLIEDYGANVRAENDLAVQWASGGGHLEVVKYLAEKCGANARAENDEAVQWASENGHLEVVKYLVKKYGSGVTYAVIWACKAGHLEVVKYLVEECRANARAEDDCAIRWACRAGHLEVVKYLVEKCGADARAEDDSAVQCASENEHLEVVKYLVEKCGSVLSEINPKYERYLIVCEKGETRRKCTMAKRIYFWWVLLH